MPEFAIEVDGDRSVALRFDQFPERARAAIARRMAGITQQLLAQVRGAEPVRTGRLRGETEAFVDNRTNAVVGRVTVAAPESAEHGKGAALEYGAHKPVSVKGYDRRQTHIWAHLIQPREVLVSAYNRRANIAERRYLRGPLDSMRGTIIEELRQALLEAAAE